MPTPSPRRATGSSLEPPSILWLLRTHTGPAHERLEAALPLADPALSPATYLALLARFRRLYVAAEQGVAPWAAELAGYGVALDERRKSPLIERDLTTLGAAAAAGAPSPPLAAPTLGRAFGVLYVLEGSTLGGQVVLRQLRQTLGVTPEAGGAFFASYGGQVGPMWRQFCAALEAHAARVPHECADVLAGASATFLAFARELLDADPPAPPPADRPA